MSSTSKKNIVLKSSDGMIIEVEEAVALQSETIAHMVEEDCVTDGIPISNVTGEILSLMIKYCEKHVVVVDGDGGGSSSSSGEDLKNWDAKFMNDLDQSTLFNLILAANFLNVKSLLDLTFQTVADTMLKGKSVDEIRKALNIENDFTPEEETQIREENQWAFE